MTSPKAALELCIEDLQTIGDGLSDGTIAIAKAAILVAELHETFWSFVFTPSGVDIDDYGYDMDQFWPEIIELRRKMEALK